MRKFWFLLPISALILISACGGKSEKSVSTDCPVGESCFQRSAQLNVTNISEADLPPRSHNNGQNCFACHQNYGPGIGIFTLAGTLFSPDGSAYTKGEVKIFSTNARTDDDLVLTVQVDGYGNFFTTEELQVPDSGFFVSVFSESGAEKRMNSPKISLSCNICHAGSFQIMVP